MTKTELVTLVGKRLGDTTTGASGFLPQLTEVLDQVLGEMAMNECLGSLRREASFQFTAGTGSYSTGTATGLASSPTQFYPIRIEKLFVPTWGYQAALEKIVDESVWDARVSQWEPTYAARPQFWRVYPNETQLQVFPIPTADDVTALALKILYWAPPTVLGDNDQITEIRPENINVVIAGCITYGAPFQDETLIDKPMAERKFQEGMALMRRQQIRARVGDVQRIRYNRSA